MIIPKILGTIRSNEKCDTNFVCSSVFIKKMRQFFLIKRIENYTITSFSIQFLIVKLSHYY